MRRLLISLCLSLLASVLPVHAAFVPVKMMPADNSEVLSLSTITVIWPGEWLEGVAWGVCGRVENESGAQVATLTCEENYSYEEAATDLILSEKITAAGNYTVYVDADTAFSEDEEGNDPFTIHYTIGENSQLEIKLVSATPENNSTVSALSTVETYWSEKISSVNTEITCEVLDIFDDSVAEVTVSKGVFSTSPVTFTLKKSLDTAGTYKLVIPAGVLESADGMKSEAVTLTYTVNPSTVETLTPIDIDPADKSVLTTLSEFNITWDAEFDFDFYANEVGRVVDESGTNAALITCYADIMEENMIIFELSQPISAAGEYTVIIEAGRIIATNGAKNEEITLTYTIDSSLIETNLEMTVTPDESVKIVTQTFPNVKLLFDEVVDMNISEFMFESDNDEWVFVTATLDFDEAELDCSEIEKAGTWTLTIPEGAFKSVETGSINPEKTYKWVFAPTATGLDESYSLKDYITVSPEKVETRGYDEVRVYDLFGHQIANCQGDVDITLSSGIYFIQCISNNHSTTYKVVL